MYNTPTKEVSPKMRAFAKELCDILTNETVKFLHDKNMKNVEHVSFGIDGLQFSIQEGLPVGGIDVSLHLEDKDGDTVAWII